MRENFFFCNEDLVGRLSSDSSQDCPLCSKPMTVSGWVTGLDEKRAEKGSEGFSEALAI